MTPHEVPLSPTRFSHTLPPHPNRPRTPRTPQRVYYATVPGYAFTSSIITNVTPPRRLSSWRPVGTPSWRPSQPYTPPTRRRWRCTACCRWGGKCRGIARMFGKTVQDALKTAEAVTKCAAVRGQCNKRWRKGLAGAVAGVGQACAAQILSGTPPGRWPVSSLAASHRHAPNHHTATFASTTHVHVHGRADRLRGGWRRHRRQPPAWVRQHPQRPQRPRRPLQPQRYQRLQRPQRLQRQPRLLLASGSHAAPPHGVAAGLLRELAVVVRGLPAPRPGQGGALGAGCEGYIHD